MAETFSKKPDIDLGDGHVLYFTTYAGNPRVGGVIEHTKRDGSICAGSIWFDKAIVDQHFPSKPVWTVECWEPLTVSPSFLCHCGDHGFIKNGKWERA